MEEGLSEYQQTSNKTQWVQSKIELMTQDDTYQSQQSLILLQKISQTDSTSFTPPHLIEALHTITNTSNDIIKIRILELIITICNENEEIFQRYDESGLIDLALNIYQTDDILLKLTAIEVIALFGNSPHCSLRLVSSPLKQVISNDLNSNITDAYVKNHLIVLLAKLFYHTRYPDLLADSFWPVLLEMLEGDVSSVNQAITAICYLADCPEGLQNLISAESHIMAFGKMQNSTVGDKKQAFYVTLAVMLKGCSEEDALQLLRKIDGWDRKLNQQLLVPLDEVLIAAMKCSVQISKYAWGANSLFSNPQVAEILLKRSPNFSSDMCHLKYEINKNAVEHINDSLLQERLGKYIQEGVFAAQPFMEEAATRAPGQ